MTNSTPLGGWKQIANYPDFVKWSYKSSPYRVIADLNEDTGHWRAVYTSVWGGSHLIRGNCGGGSAGFLKASLSAQQFMQENRYGCPPPKEFN